MVCSEPLERRTLNRVRDLLTPAAGAVRSPAGGLSGSLGAGGLVARAANRHLGKNDREAAGVLSSAQRHTPFLDSPRMAAVMGRSDFSFADLKAEVATVFLVLPPDRLDAYARWLRLMVVQALTELARSPARPPSPVLFLLDEFAALGRLQAVERAFGLMAGYGAAALGHPAGHPPAARRLWRAGRRLPVQRRRGAGLQRGRLRHRQLGLTPDWGHNPGLHHHLHQLPPDQALLLRPGHAPASVRKVRYFADPEFKGMFDAP